MTTECDCGATSQGPWADIHSENCATIKDDTPLPEKAALKKALKSVEFCRSNAGKLAPEELKELVEAARWALHAIPSEMDFLDFCVRHPINQVYFRAGLLACREYMARFVEQGGHPEIAQSIRANWWPQLGDDPGAPRLFDFAELADEIEQPDGRVIFRSKDVPLNVEALPRAYQFLGCGAVCDPALREVGIGAQAGRASIHLRLRSRRLRGRTHPLDR